MLDFEEELKKFTPSEEVEAENTKANTSQESDMADILMELLKN